MSGPDRPGILETAQAPADTLAGAETPAETHIADTLAGAETPAETHIADTLAGAETPAETHIVDTLAGTETPAETHIVDTLAGAETPAETHIADTLAGAEDAAPAHSAAAFPRPQAPLAVSEAPSIPPSDEELVRAAQNGDEAAEEFLIRKYKGVVKSKAHIYFIAGADAEDIVQEGMIGIFKAIRSFDCSKQTSFRTFAEICINRQIITAVKRATRLKHSPLNTSISLNRPMPGDNSTKTLGETLFSGSAFDPEARFIMKEAMDYIEQNGGKLFSNLERQVWSEYQRGKSYEEIARVLGKSSKTVDNAIQRTKKKLALYLGTAP